MSKPLSLGIVIPSNVAGGPQKVTAVLAADLALEGHSVIIFASVMPHYYYFVSLRRQPLSWLKYVATYIVDWAFGKKFFFQDTLEDGLKDTKGRGNIVFKFVPRSASKSQLDGLDYLIFHSIAQVEEYQHKFPQERQIYLLHHLEEHNHGSKEVFKEIRQSFLGKIIAVSPFTGNEIKKDIPNLPMVVNPITPAIWAQRETFDAAANRQDILLFWKDQKSGLMGIEIIQELRSIRPEITVTIWCRGVGNIEEAKQSLPNTTIVEHVTENQLIDLYLGHSFLLFCSTFEGFGMPPIEALACGCIPVLHPDVGAAELYAKDGENAVFLGNDLTVVAHRLLEILSDLPRLQTMRQASPLSIGSFKPRGYGGRLLRAAGVFGN